MPDHPAASSVRMRGIFRAWASSMAPASIMRSIRLASNGVSVSSGNAGRCAAHPHRAGAGSGHATRKTSCPSLRTRTAPVQSAAGRLHGYGPHRRGPAPPDAGAGPRSPRARRFPSTGRSRFRYRRNIHNAVEQGLRYSPRSSDQQRKGGSLDVPQRPLSPCPQRKTGVENPESRTADVGSVPALGGRLCGDEETRGRPDGNPYMISPSKRSASEAPPPTFRRR